MKLMEKTQENQHLRLDTMGRRYRDLNQLRNRRESKFEALRILAMIAITLSHVPNIAEGSNVTHFLRSFNYCFGGFGDNLFVIVGCWFLVDSKAKFDRVVRLVFQVCFYSACLSIASKLMGSNVTVRGFFASFSYWFPFGYVFMLILFPFIKRVKMSAQKVIVWTVGGVCLAVTIAKMLGHNNAILRLFSKGLFIGPLWFCTVFAFINCYKSKLKALFDQHNSILFIFVSICTHLVMTVVGSSGVFLPT